MSSVVVVKGNDGKLVGLGDKGARQFARFHAKVRDLEPGETMHFEWREPRSPGFHRLFFATLNALFDAQEQFADMEQLRAWLTVGAGYCEFVPGPTGRMVALPKSIAWHNLDESDFREFVSAMDAFLWTEHAQRFLWPHLSADLQHDNIERLMLEFRSAA